MILFSKNSIVLSLSLIVSFAAFKLKSKDSIFDSRIDIYVSSRFVEIGWSDIAIDKLFTNLLFSFSNSEIYIEVSGWPVSDSLTFKDLHSSSTFLYSK